MNLIEKLTSAWIKWSEGPALNALFSAGFVRSLSQLLVSPCSPQLAPVFTSTVSALHSLIIRSPDAALFLAAVDGVAAMVQSATFTSTQAVAAVVWPIAFVAAGNPSPLVPVKTAPALNPSDAELVRTHTPE